MLATLLMETQGVRRRHYSREHQLFFSSICAIGWVVPATDPYYYCRLLTQKDISHVFDCKKHSHPRC
jgi:hypothetical protein